jgi:hypothetical protein
MQKLLIILENTTDISLKASIYQATDRNNSKHINFSNIPSNELAHQNQLDDENDFFPRMEV